MPQDKISVNCPHCNRAYAVSPEMAGKTAKCSGCLTRFSIPSTEPPPLPANRKTAIAPAAKKPSPAPRTRNTHSHSSRGLRIITTLLAIIALACVGFVLVSILTDNDEIVDDSPPKTDSKSPLNEKENDDATDTRQPTPKPDDPTLPKPDAKDGAQKPPENTSKHEHKENNSYKTLPPPMPTTKDPVVKAPEVKNAEQKPPKVVTRKEPSGVIIGLENPRKVLGLPTFEITRPSNRDGLPDKNYRRYLNELIHKTDIIQITGRVTNFTATQITLQHPQASFVVYANFNSTQRYLIPYLQIGQLLTVRGRYNKTSSDKSQIIMDSTCMCTLRD